MPKIDVTTKIPEPAAGQWTAWIHLGGNKSLAAAKTLKAHPGWEDYARRAEAGEVKALYLTASSPQLLFLPADKIAGGYPDREQARTAAAEALDMARAAGVAELVFLLDAPRGGDLAAEAAEGLAVRAYAFVKYKQNNNAGPMPAVTLTVPSKVRAKVKRAVEDRLKLCESLNRARDLVNEPGSVATPAEIEKRARDLAERAGLEIEVLDAKQLKKEGYEGLLAVGRGSEVPPRMIVLRYAPRGAKAKVHLGLLGKGVTFDTGGVSIKPASKMWQMKGDMGGAAATLYALEAIAEAGLKIRTTAIIVTTQNYVDAKAIVPGDIFRARNGKYVQVDNTDAEGRLILTDGLWRAGEEEVTHLIDVATLTGSIVRALGTDFIGAFGNDRFVDRVARVGNGCGEPTWKMPLYEPYRELLKCDAADLNNIGSTPNGGSITAALFLKEFVPEGISWTHLDIAGVFLQEKKWNAFGPGATGASLRTLAGVARDLSGKK